MQQRANSILTYSNLCMGSDGGYSFIELLMALAVSSILLCSLWQVHGVITSSQTYRQMLWDLAAQGNLLQQMFSSRLAEAGFFGYRHIDANYPVVNTVCPALLGHNIAAVRVLTANDGEHIQISWLDKQAVAVRTIDNDETLVLANTTALTAGMVVGIGDLVQGFVDKVIKVSQRGSETKIVLQTPLPALTLPAMVGEFHGVDDNVAKTSQADLGLWEQACDGKRNLMLGHIKAWALFLHIPKQQGFTKNLAGNDAIDGIRIDLLLQSESPLLPSPMRYHWQGQSVLAGDRFFYLPWRIETNLGQMKPG